MRKADNRDLLQAYLLTSLRPSMSGQNGQAFVDQNRNIEAKGLDAARNLRNLLPAMLLGLRRSSLRMPKGTFSIDKLRAAFFVTLRSLDSGRPA